MGLAPYGKPVYANQYWKKLFPSKKMSYTLNNEYFGYTHSKMITEKFCELLEIRRDLRNRNYTVLYGYSSFNTKGS